MRNSPFEEAPKNLIILGDIKSGTMVICHEEHYISRRKENQGNEHELIAFINGSPNKERSVNKFIVNLIPRVALVPSISQETGPVLDYTLVRSPAPNILVRSTLVINLQLLEYQFLLPSHTSR